MKTIKKVEKLIDKGEARKQKLVSKIEDLKQEEKALYEAVQDDFNLAIIEDKEPSKKLSSDLEKVRQELKEKQFQLSQIDAVVQKELEKAKAEVEEERREYEAEKREEFRKLFDEINEAKLEFLNKLIEYRNKHREYSSEHVRTFKDIHERVGLRMPDPREHNKIFLQQRHQISDRYSPMVYMDELRGALVDGKLPFATEKNKEAFKK
ncbi:hypothetical protein [Virgibacillus siamensis]|uniref:hypothetical protein n=1 Tax=Virgibacillus siamensis TaxID=480071 RepID=UPI0009845F49|nr:hypothetical protein [Virgibacillus siamensis]